MYHFSPIWLEKLQSLIMHFIDETQENKWFQLFCGNFKIAWLLKRIIWPHQIKLKMYLCVDLPGL